MADKATDASKSLIGFLKDVLALVGTLAIVVAIIADFNNMPAFAPYIEKLPFKLPPITPDQAKTLFMAGSSCLSIALGSKLDGLLSLVSRAA